MKIRLDFDNKTIQLEDAVGITEFIDKINDILPNIEGWTISPTKPYEWNNNITLKYPSDRNWWNRQEVTYTEPYCEGIIYNDTPTMFNSNNTLNESIPTSGQHDIDV